MISKIQQRETFVGMLFPPRDRVISSSMRLRSKKTTLHEECNAVTKFLRYSPWLLIQLAIFYERNKWGNDSPQERLEGINFREGWAADPRFVSGREVRRQGLPAPQLHNLGGEAAR